MEPTELGLPLVWQEIEWGDPEETDHVSHGQEIELGDPEETDHVSHGQEIEWGDPDNIQKNHSADTRCCRVC